MNNLKNFRNLTSILPLLLGFGLFIYLVLRVFIVAMTDDECLTLFYHVLPENWWSLLTDGLENQGWAGNNHVLNSIFMKLEFMIFGRKDWALRLHILASFVVCFYFTSKTIAQITPSSLKQFCYLAIIFVNPFLLDFFGLSRGYALSMAAWAFAFYYFTKYTMQPNLSYLSKSLLGLFMGVWANYSALYIALFFGFMFLFEFYKHIKEAYIKKHFLYLFLGYLSILVVNIIPLFRTLVANNAYGGQTSIFQDTVVSWIDRFIHHSIEIDRFAKYNETWTNLEVYGLIGVSIWILIISLSLIIKTDRYVVKKINHTTIFITIGIAVLIKILFVLFKTPYPMGRTALLFSFPFLLSLFSAFDILSEKFKVFNLLFITVIPFLFWHANICFNLDNTREWWQQGDAKKVMSFMKNYLETHKQQKTARLGCESYQFFPILFYAEPEFTNIIKVEFTELKKDEHYDFLFVPFFRTNEVWTDYEQLEVFRHGTLFIKKTLKY